MSKLIDPSYLFSLLPGAPNLFFWKIVIGLAILAILWGMIAVFMGRKNKRDGLKRKLWYRWSVWGLIIGPICLLLAFFRFQNVLYLSMRFLIFAWLFFAAIRFVFIIKYWFMEMPKRVKQREKEKAYTQYLPGKKS
jgi:amino acid transporter